MNVNTNLRVFFAHGNPESRAEIEGMLSKLEHRLELVTDSGKRLIEACARQAPDLMIAGTTLSDMDGIDALVEICRGEPVPAILIADKASRQKVERALEDHVMAYMVEPVSLEDLQPTILLVERRFQEFQQLREENRELRLALENRKWVERAKGILMRDKGLTEEEAYRALQKMASERRTKMPAIARTIVEAAQMLAG